MPGKGRQIQDVDKNSPAGERRDRVLIAAALIPLASLALLRELNVPLGCPGRFVYLYSPRELLGWRFSSVPYALLIAAVLGLAVWLIADADRAKRALGFTLLTGGSLALGIWAYVAPPNHFIEHAFNMLSPSQDGAFLREGFGFDSAGQYLRSFPQRAVMSPERMRGTRVISNPPGATLLAYGCRRLVEAVPPLERYLRRQFEMPGAGDVQDFIDTASVGLLFTWVLTGAWLLAGVFLYRMGRLFFDPAAAAAFSACVLFNPMTLLFTPGKDTAQLLTAAIPLWLWFLGWRRRSAWAAAAAGAAFALATMVSLVHVWLAAIALAAVVAAEAARPRALAKRLVFPALAGAFAVCVIAYVACGVNIPATLVAVARSQAVVTRGSSAMPWLWQCLGVPLFALFAGPAIWAGCLSAGGARLSPLAATRDDRRFTKCLLLSMAGVLIATVGFTNLETPRLWIPFLPLLLLGLWLLSEAPKRPGARARICLAVLVAVQIAGSVLIWALMDAREAEHRLLSGSYFW